MSHITSVPAAGAHGASIQRTARRALMAAAIATASVTTLALPIAGPLAAHAAPAGVTSARGWARQTDAVAERASQALATVKRYLETGDATLLASFEDSLGLIAEQVAARLELDPVAMRRAWAAADLEHQTALVAALGQLGVSYRRNTSKPGVGFDCSGLTAYAWAQAGVTITRQSSAQIKAASPRDTTTAQAGDLVQYPGHVMMWLGVDRAVVHAVMSGKPVAVDVISAGKSIRFGDPTS